MYSCFTPGKPWLDIDGNPIQAHGGYMYYENSTYYWIGENKEFTDGVNGIWHNGVRCYSSEDLYNWNSEGIIIPAEEDENSTIDKVSGGLKRTNNKLINDFKLRLCGIKTEI